MCIGDLYWVNLGKEETNENQCVQKGKRPCLVLGNKMTYNSKVVTIIPFTSNLKKLERIPTHLLIDEIDGLKSSVLLPEQIQTVNKSQIIGSRIGRLSSETLDLVSDCLKKQFFGKI